MLKYLFVILFLFISKSYSAGQTVDHLKLQRDKIEIEINKLNNLISESEKNKNVYIQQIKLYNQKISKVKALIASYNDEISDLNSDIANNSKVISELTSHRTQLLQFYSKAVYNQWKTRNRNYELLYVLSSETFSQAYRRFRYFKESQYFVKNKLYEIERINDSLDILNRKNSDMIKSISLIRNKVDGQNIILNKDKDKEMKLLSSVSKNEISLRKKLSTEIANRKKLDEQIKNLITEQVKKSGSREEKAIRLTQKELNLAKDFSQNKGKLPWPVSNGVITEKFGTHRDVVHTNVQVSNDGISITAKKNSAVWSVFNGVVSNIIHITGLNNVVLIRHGNYFTLYGNLSDVVVRTGQIVSTGQMIGNLTYSADKGSVLQFQIWKNLEKLNPEYWLRK